MPRTIAWALLCSSGEVHEFEEHTGLFLDAGQAEDGRYVLDDDIEEGCGPHTVHELVDRAEAQAAIAQERQLREQIEQRCDPAGDTRTIGELRDTIRCLEAALAEAQEEKLAMVKKYSHLEQEGIRADMLTEENERLNGKEA